MSITPFSNGEFDLPLIVDGDTFKVLAPQLAKALGMRDAARLMESIPENEKGYTLASTPGGPQRVGYLTEAGFYRALGQRQAARIADEAIRAQVERFQAWVYSDLLPTFRKHGAYMSPAVIEQTLTDPDFIIGLAQRLKDEQAKTRILAPKAAAFDLWLSSNADYGIDAAAKALCAGGYMTGRNRLFEQLAELGWAYKAADGWRYTQPHGPEGTKRLAIRMSYYTNSKTGESQGRTTLRITAKGVHDLAAKVGANPALVADALDSEAGVA